MWLDLRLFLLIPYLSDNAINAAKLVKLQVNNNGFDVFKYNLDDDSDGKVPNDKFKGLNSALVKRLVPHGYKTKGLEYNKRLQTYYKPIVRLHNGKIVRIPLVSEDELSSDEVYKTNELNDFLQHVFDESLKRDDRKREDRVEKDATELLLQLESLRSKGISRNDGDGKLNKISQAILNNINSSLDKLYGDKAEEKKKFIKRALDKIKSFKEKKDLLQTLIRAVTFLRTREEDKQGVDILNSIFLNPDEIHQTEKPKVQLPYVPYWNYWTYEKSLHVDNCKHGWIRYHNMCIEMPPH